MIRIFVNILPFYLQQSTDIDYARSLKNSSTALNANFYYPHKWTWGIWENIQLIINKLLSIFKCKKRFHIIYPKRYLNSEFNTKDFDIVYSQGTCPQNTGNIPILIESGLWLPGQNRTYTKEDETHFKHYTIKLFQDYLSHPTIINLKSDIEIENARKLFPSYSNRFVKLPFILPKLIPISKQELLDKHNNDEVIRIGFLGGQAIRKGLLELISAYKKVKAELAGRKKIELHIISSYHDGNINIPQGLDIFEYGKLPYDAAQKIMKTWHIFAMISRNESYGLVYIEAMANGCINIARDFYPQKEFVEFGKIGFLASPENIDSISASLKQAVLLERGHRVSMALAGLEKFKSEYAYTQVINKFKDAFNKCLSLNKQQK